MQDVKNRIQRLRPPHPHHYLAIACAGYQGELCCQLCDWRGMARAYELSVAARDAINGSDYISRNTAFDSERAGDAYAHFDLVQAQKAYRRTVRILQISDGTSQPRWKLVVKKLVEVQRRLGTTTGTSAGAGISAVTSTGSVISVGAGAGTSVAAGTGAGEGVRSKNGSGTVGQDIASGQGLDGCGLCGAPALAR